MGRRKKRVQVERLPEVVDRPVARIAVAMVSHDNVPIQFTYSLANMMMHTAANLPDGVELGLNLISGTYVHCARQEMIQELIAGGVTHILWVDTDMTFPPDALLRLMRHQRLVVGINYSQRGLPPDYVALKTVATDTTSGSKLQTLPESTGLEEVEGIGFGLVLMRVEALAGLPSPQEGPWFGFEWMPTKRDWIGEDIYFCNLLRKSGVRIYVDHDLSKECEHVGSFRYKLDQVSEWKRLEQEGEAEGE